MAEVTLAVENVVKSGLAASYTGSLSTSNTYFVRNNGRVILHFKKAGAGDCTVTVQTPKQVAGLDVAENTLTVPATTGDKFAGPFPPSVFNDANGDLKFTLSEITGLTVAVLGI